MGAGTMNNALPPPPPGFEYEDPPGGVAASQALPPPPPGFEYEDQVVHARGQPDAEFQAMDASAVPVQQKEEERTGPLRFPGERPSDAVRIMARDIAERARKGHQKVHAVGANGITQSALQGATLGFSDEIQAGIAALTAKATDLVNAKITNNPAVLQDRTLGQLYDEALSELRDEQNRFAKEKPLPAAVANLAGGLATGGAIFKGLQAAGLPAGGGIGGVAGGGAAVGAVAGAGTAQEGNRVEGALAGGFVGMLGAGIVSGLGGAVRTLFRRFSPDQRAMLANLARESGLTPTQIETRLRALGDNATLADVADVFRRAADVAASRLGPVSAKVRTLIRRDETQFGRLTEAVIRNLGGGKDRAATTLSQLKELRMQQASPLYERAFSRPIQMTDRLKDLLKRPVTQNAWRRVQTIGRSDPDVDLSQLAQGADPSFRGWQAITEHLADRIESLRRAGKNKEAGIVANLRRAILDELDAQSPEYRKARTLWAGTKRADDMVELGNKLFKLRTGEILEQMRTMSEADKAFFRVGVGQAIEERMAGITDTNDLTRLFRNQAFRDKVFAIFPDKRSATDFLNTVRAETEKKVTANLVGRGSQTQPRQAAERQLLGGDIPIGGNNGGLLSAAVRKAVNMVRPSEKTIQDVGELLLSQDPADQRRAIQMIQANPSLLRLTGTTAAAANISGQLGVK